MDKKIVVMLHGAGTGAWIWERVSALIRNPTFAPDVPSRAKDSTPATCADAIVKEIDERGRDHVVLVMHSLAGVLASEIADRLGERLVSCVYISAIIPADGSTFTKAIGFPGRLLLPILFFFNPGGLLPSEAMIRNELCTDLSKDDCSMVINRYEAEFPGLYLTKVAGPPKCHSAYIRLLNDASISPIQQSNMIAHLDEPDVFELAAGHMVMLSQPEDLANILNHIVELPGSKQLPVL